MNLLRSKSLQSYIQHTDGLQTRTTLYISDRANYQTNLNQHHYSMDLTELTQIKGGGMMDLSEISPTNDTKARIITSEQVTQHIQSVKSKKEQIEEFLEQQISVQKVTAILRSLVEALSNQQFFLQQINKIVQSNHLVLQASINSNQGRTHSNQIKIQQQAKLQSKDCLSSLKQKSSKEAQVSKRSQIQLNSQNLSKAQSKHVSQVIGNQSQINQQNNQNFAFSNRSIIQVKFIQMDKALSSYKKQTRQLQFEIKRLKQEIKLLYRDLQLTQAIRDDENQEVQLANRRYYQVLLDFQDHIKALKSKLQAEQQIKTRTVHDQLTKIQTIIKQKIEEIQLQKSYRDFFEVKKELQAATLRQSYIHIKISKESSYSEKDVNDSKNILQKRSGFQTKGEIEEQQWNPEKQEINLQQAEQLQPQTQSINSAIHLTPTNSVAQTQINNNHLIGSYYQDTHWSNSSSAASQENAISRTDPQNSGAQNIVSSDSSNFSILHQLIAEEYCSTH